MNHLGIFDSGIGGLTILSNILKNSYLSKKIDRITYFADNKNLPYGNRSEEFITSRIEEICSKLEQLGCTTVLSACHTASVVINKTGFHKKGLINVSTPTVNLIQSLVDSPIHLIDPLIVMGTVLTINSGIYQKAAYSHAINHPKHNFLFVPAPNLAEDIEKGNSLSVANVDQFLQQKLSQGINRISLALVCTHYPLFKERIAHLLFSKDSKNIILNSYNPSSVSKNLDNFENIKEDSQQRKEFLIVNLLPIEQEVCQHLQRFIDTSEKGENGNNIEESIHSAEIDHMKTKNFIEIEFFYNGEISLNMQKQISSLLAGSNLPCKIDIKKI